MTVEEFDIGDKIEITDTVNDTVRQGWVTDVWGSDSATHVTLKGFNHTVYFDATDEVRVLVKKPKPLAVGDEIVNPKAADLPIGTVIMKSRIGWPWIVMRNSEGKHVFVGMLDNKRTHPAFMSRYTIAHIINVEEI